MQSAHAYLVGDMEGLSFLFLLICFHKGFIILPFNLFKQLLAYSLLDDRTL